MPWHQYAALGFFASSFLFWGFREFVLYDSRNRQFTELVRQRANNEIAQSDWDEHRRKQHRNDQLDRLSQGLLLVAAVAMIVTISVE